MIIVRICNNYVVQLNLCFPHFNFSKENTIQYISVIYFCYSYHAIFNINNHHLYAYRIAI